VSVKFIVILETSSGWSVDVNTGVFVSTDVNTGVFVSIDVSTDVPTGMASGLHSRDSVHHS